MEAPTGGETAPISASTPPLQPQQPAPAPAPVQEMESGGVFVKGGKMNYKDIVVTALLVGASIFGIIYYRKAIKQIDDNKDSTEMDDLISDVEEIKMNVKKMMGNAYKSV